jgi:hypothetical protein
MSWPPAVSDFKAYFVREFSYGDGQDSVTDPDITRALNEALDGSYFSQGLWDTVQQRTTALLYLAAHLMVMNIQQMAGGLSAVPRGRGVRNAGEGVQVSKGVGPSNVTYMVPSPRVAENPMFLYFFMTTFGQRYMQMAEPRTVGNMAIVGGPNGYFPPDGFNPV